jgi:hypothetical protein
MRIDVPFVEPLAAQILPQNCPVVVANKTARPMAKWGIKFRRLQNFNVADAHRSRLLRVFTSKRVQLRKQRGRAL